jgi:hypothetical protein
LDPATPPRRIPVARRLVFDGPTLRRKAVTGVDERTLAGVIVGGASIALSGAEPGSRRRVASSARGSRCLHEAPAMMLTPSITLRGFGRSPALEADVRRRIAKLETFYPSIIGCRVLVEHAQKHHHAGNRFHVRIDLTVPGGELVIAHDASRHGEQRELQAVTGRKADEPAPQRKYVQIAVREAFEAARRRLQDFARRQRGDVKSRAFTSQPIGGPS